MKNEDAMAGNFFNSNKNDDGIDKNILNQKIVRVFHFQTKFVVKIAQKKSRIWTYKITSSEINK